MSNDRFLKARNAKATTDFIESVNDDVKPVTKPQSIKTRGNKQLDLEPNQLSNKERSRSKHGRTLITHLFVEELELIEQTVEQLSDPSISNFVRETLLARCQSVLGKERYNLTNDNKRNVVKKSKYIVK